MVIATVKTRHVLKRALQGLSDNRCTQWVKSLGHIEKVMFQAMTGGIFAWPAACLQLACSVHIVIKVHLKVIVVIWGLYK